MTDHPSPAEFRGHFPAFADTVHLASCSQGALSDALTAELSEFQHTIREYGAPWDRWMAKVAEAREAFARLIGAGPDDIAVVPSASEGAYQVASTQSWSRQPGLVTTDLEFPSIAHVWLAQQDRGADVRFAAHHNGLVDVEDYAALIGEDTRLVSVPLISYANGLRFPVSEIAELARERGARTFVDAYQGLGVEPVDVTRLGCDYLVSGSLKYLLGISGIAFLYVRPGLRDAVPPPLTGWFGRTNPFEFDPRHLDHPEHARRFETGTPSIPSAYGAVAGLSLIHQLDAVRVRDRLRALTGQLQERLLEAGERLRSPVDEARRGPLVALADDDPDALAAFLAERRIVCSARGDVLRMSLHYYNDESDLDTVVRAIAEHRSSR
ncbi:aminotransferase class V-fold PLP-dependent enzyme [Amycolatopsis jiangsuensis]|uniref:Selenocysteine lyase/cysteine desulfurase n=1 Tax=Amycolatopsis jiangsuensis TaxID=1181879 RepID=A0A840IZE0_9PSEU|nr:aminotransferase class V-fold PLP-dependent enzyme [Amycolatopsis jiangsuensis]MBB4688046.1 selenocysteine lyase/cysteine desulfurase [Amycolatopsis jiangsuensis]